MTTYDETYFFSCSAPDFRHTLRRRETGTQTLSAPGGTGRRRTGRCHNRNFREFRKPPKHHPSTTGQQSILGKIDPAPTLFFRHQRSSEKRSAAHAPTHTAHRRKINHSTGETVLSLRELFHLPGHGGCFRVRGQKKQLIPGSSGTIRSIHNLS